MTQYVRVIILLVKEIQSKPAFPVLLRNVPVGRSRLSPAKLADFTQGFTKNPHHLTFPFTLQQYTRSHAPALGGFFVSIQRIFPKIAVPNFQKISRVRG